MNFNIKDEDNSLKSLGLDALIFPHDHHPCLVRHSVHFCRHCRTKSRRPVKNFLLPKFTTTQIIAPMAIFRMPSGFVFFSIFFLVSFADALCSSVCACIPWLSCELFLYHEMLSRFTCSFCALSLSHPSSLSLNYIAAHSSKRERFNNFLFIYVFRENKFADVDAETFYGHQKKAEERERKN